MQELKPCPFCGGEANPYNYVKKYLIECDYCKEYGHGAYVVARTEAEAIEAWNTRAERTCHVIGEEYDDLLEYSSVEFSCGHYAIGLPSYFAYCPKCGAKVVEK